LRKVVTKMQIDWFTVGAQTINFLLLVWLLKRYLYVPILNAIDARESHVAKVLSDADTIKSEAELERKLFDQKNFEINAKHDELLKESKMIACEKGEQIIINAYKKADDISKNRLLVLERELQNYHNNIAVKSLKEIYEITRKVLAELADVKLEEKMFECFSKHLQSITPEEKNNLNKIIESGKSGLILYSAFELTPAKIKKTNAILQQVISPNINRHYPLKHEIKPELISGIELRSNGWKIAWNSEDYLNVLQTNIKQRLDEQRETINSKNKQLNTSSHTAKISV
jgi:F-type H+-transporting ATPase subunit b